MEKRRRIVSVVVMLHCVVVVVGLEWMTVVVVGVVAESQTLSTLLQLLLLL